MHLPFVKNRNILLAILVQIVRKADERLDLSISYSLPDFNFHYRFKLRVTKANVINNFYFHCSSLQNGG